MKEISKKFKKNVLTLNCLALISMGETAINSPDQWIDYAEKQIRGNKSSGMFSMKIVTEDWTRTIKLSADIEGRDKAIIFIKSPKKEKGIGTLRIKNKMWNYFPKLRRTVAIAPSMLLTSWMGSDFTNDDLLKSSSLAIDYNHKFLKDKKVEGINYKVIENLSKENSKVLWPKIIYLANKKDCLPRYQYYYDKENKLIRTLTLKDVKTFDGHKLPTKWIMKKNDQNKKHTVLNYEKMNYSANFKKRHFSLNSLSRER